MKRRSFLGLLGAAPVAGPIAIKQAAERASGELMAIHGLPGSHHIENPTSAMGIPTEDGEHWWKKLKRFLIKEKIPDWYIDQLREQYRPVYSLDPDLADAKKSWSLSVKIITQRERNLKRALEAMKKDPDRRDERWNFYEKYGFHL